MYRPVEQLGKVGNTVWGKNHHGQTCYALVIPTNPRTEAQQANRYRFGSLGPRWSLVLTEANRALWEADARKHFTHGRFGKRAKLIGFLRYMQVNALRASQGLPPLDVPPSALGLEPAAFPPASKAPAPRPDPAPPTPRVPVHYRTATVATRFQRAWPPLGPPFTPDGGQDGRHRRGQNEVSPLFCALSPPSCGKTLF